MTFVDGEDIASTYLQATPAMRYHQIPLALHDFGADFVVGPDPMNAGWPAYQIVAALYRFDLRWVVFDFDECINHPPLPMPLDLADWFVKCRDFLPEHWSRYRIASDAVRCVRLEFCFPQRPLCTVHARDDRDGLYEVGVKRPAGVHAVEPLERASALCRTIDPSRFRHYADRQRALVEENANKTPPDGWIVRV